MFKILPVKKEDFNQVYPLLTQIPAPVTIPRETWQNLFERKWDAQVEPFGYVFLKDSEIVGYIGLITVQREINGQRHEIMDVTSWTVDKKYGGYAIQMLFPFIRDQKRTLRCFTPAKSVDAIFRKFGFEELSACLQIIPFWAISPGRHAFEITFDIEGHRQLLSKEGWQIYHDHRPFASEHFLIKKGQACCYVVAKRIFKKRLPFLHVHYVSDKKLFASSIQKFVGTICLRTKILGLIVFENCLGQEHLPGAIKKRMPSKPLFRSTDLKPENIDSLYSEYFLLNF